MAFCYKTVYKEEQSIFGNETAKENRLVLYFKPSRTEGLLGDILLNAKGACKYTITLANQTQDNGAKYLNQEIEGIYCYDFSMEELGATAPVYRTDTNRLVSKRCVATWLSRDETLVQEKQGLLNRLMDGSYTYEKPEVGQ